MMKGMKNLVWHHVTVTWGGVIWSALADRPERFAWL